MVTIKDIAARLKVSPATVSKALNDRADVSIELKNRITSTAQKMGYRPNPIAQRLVSGKSKTIGLFILNGDKISLKESFALYTLESITAKAHSNGYDIMLINSKSPEKKTYGDICNERMIDGAIFIGLTLDDPRIKDMGKSKIPISIIDQFVKGKNIGHITTHNQAGIEMGLQHLYDGGHRHIAFIAACDNSEVSNIRKETYIQFMQNKNILQDSNIYEGDFSQLSGYKIGKEISALEKLPDAIFASSDIMAMGCIEGLREENIKVPEDISVIGFDDIPLSGSFTPPLTTISQNIDLIGESAVSFILDKIKGKDSDNVFLIRPELKIRKSVKLLK